MGSIKWVSGSGPVSLSHAGAKGARMWNLFLLLFLSGPLWSLGLRADTGETGDTGDTGDVGETGVTADDLLLTVDDLLTGADDLQTTEDNLLLNEAVELLQIHIVQRLEESLRSAQTSLQEREREVESTKAELVRTERRLEYKLEKSWTLVKFMLKVVKKSQEAAKAREELM